nr:MAG TPA: hypothetical protein [Caudoviricetes sp.]
MKKRYEGKDGFFSSFHFLKISSPSGSKSGLWDRGCGRMVIAVRDAPQGHQCGRRSGRQS